MIEVSMVGNSYGVEIRCDAMFIALCKPNHIVRTCAKE